MNDQNETAQLHFLEETAIRLRQNGFTVEPIEDHHLPVCLSLIHIYYITYKPNKRAQADLSAHRPDGLRLRGGNRAKLNNNSYILQYTVYVKK